MEGYTNSPNYEVTNTYSAGHHYIKVIAQEPDNPTGDPFIRLYQGTDTSTVGSELTSVTLETSVYTFLIHKFSRPEYCELTSEWPLVADPTKELVAGTEDLLQLTSKNGCTDGTTISCGYDCGEDDLYTVTFTAINDSQTTDYTVTSTYVSEVHEVPIVPTIAGDYEMNVTMKNSRFPDDDQEIDGSPFLLKVLPDKSHPPYCELDVTEPMIEQEEGLPNVIPIIVRDIFENLTSDIRGNF